MVKNSAWSLRKFFMVGVLSVLQTRLLDGDRIYFPSLSEDFVTVLGEVGSQRMVLMPTVGLKLSEALAQVGGISLATADYNGIYIARDNESGGGLFKLSVADAMISNPELHANDVVFVAPTGLARWSRFWSLVLPGTAAGAGVSLMYNNFDIGDNRAPN